MPRTLKGGAERLEPELSPEQQVTESRFDCILLVQIAAGSDIEQIDVQWTVIVVIGKVLSFHAEDEHSPFKVEP